MRSTAICALMAVALVSCTRGETPRGADTSAVAADTARLSVAPTGIDMVLNLTDEIGVGTSRTDLITKFGASNVTDTIIYGTEGERRPGSILFPRDSSRMVEITWIDTVARARPATARLRGNASAWTIPHGVTLGLALSELERLNGRPFSLTGFGWDYGGTVTDWKSGSLASLRTGTPRIFVRLSPEREAPAELSGDRELSSDLPAMKRLDPVVDEIVLSYETPLD
jgi:hypothetical protein